MTTERGADISRMTFPVQTVILIVTTAITVVGSTWGMRSDLRDIQTRTELRQQAYVEDAGGEDHSAPGAGSYLDVAARILRDFQLVPRVIEPVTPGGDPVPVHPANAALARLHGDIKAALRQILIDAGHPVKEEAG